MKQFLIIVLATILTGSGLQAQVQVNNELKSLINKSFAYYPKIKEVENTVITANKNWRWQASTRQR